MAPSAVMNIMFNLHPVLTESLFHLEAAGRRWSADATFFHGRSNYIAEQRFCQQTCFGVVRRGGSNWTTVGMDEVLPIFFTKTGRAAQILENAQGSVNSLLTGFAL